MNPIFTGLPTKLGLYVLDELLGERENTELYAATQSYVDRAVVLEVLRPQSTPEQVALFQESIRQRASVSLPHVCPVLESVQTGAFRYLIQEKPRGCSLRVQVAQGKLLNEAQGFTLVQTVAELYSACQEMGLAAEPPDTASIYVHNGEYTFLSPVVAGVADAAHRDAQMAGLAYVLEQVLSPDLLDKSKLAVVVHWLKNGYGGVALEWAPLLSALVSLRVQKGGGQGPDSFSSKSILHFAKRRYLKRIGRDMLRYCKVVAYAALSVLVIGCLGFFINPAPQDGSASPADGLRHIHCDYAGSQWLVHSAPVSLAEYARFLKAYENMSKEQQAQLHVGMPSNITTHQPLNWKRQLAATRGADESSMATTPVYGVSYWDAMAYARFAKEQLAPVELVQTARKYAQQKYALEEWTDTRVDGFPPYSAHFIVCPSQGDTLIRDVNPEQRPANRGFRTVQKVTESNSIPEK